MSEATVRTPALASSVPGRPAPASLPGRRRLPTMSASGWIGAACLALLVFVAVFAPVLAPHDPLAIQKDATGDIARLSPPSAQFWLGTSYYGRDTLSELLLGSRVAIAVGVLSSLLIVIVGTNVGLVAGYYGRWVDGILMRLTDITFGIPFLPFAVILVSLMGPSLWNIILAISCLMWRTTARVIRAQVLSIRERPYVKAARLAGAGDARILYYHILPNVLPLSLLYIPLGIAWAVIAEASLSFLGLGDPTVPSWGGMLYSAYLTASFRSAWWVVIPPGICISVFVAAAFLIGREVEAIVNPKLKRV